MRSIHSSPFASQNSCCTAAGRRSAPNLRLPVASTTPGGADFSRIRLVGIGLGDIWPLPIGGRLVCGQILRRSIDRWRGTVLVLRRDRVHAVAWRVPLTVGPQERVGQLGVRLVEGNAVAAGNEPLGSALVSEILGGEQLGTYPMVCQRGAALLHTAFGVEVPAAEEEESTDDDGADHDPFDDVAGLTVAAPVVAIDRLAVVV